MDEEDVLNEPKTSVDPYARYVTHDENSDELSGKHLMPLVVKSARLEELDELAKHGVCCKGPRAMLA